MQGCTATLYVYLVQTVESMLKFITDRKVGIFRSYDVDSGPDSDVDNLPDEIRQLFKEDDFTLLALNGVNFIMNYSHGSDIFKNRCKKNMMERIRNLLRFDIFVTYIKEMFLHWNEFKFSETAQDCYYLDAAMVSKLLSDLHGGFYR